MDQRVEKTYTALQKSMRGMLGEMTWDEITIQGVCGGAGVSRTTFYNHFEDKDDLLDSLLHLFEVAMLADNNGRSLSTTRSFGFLPMLLNHVSANRQLFSKTNNGTDGYPVAVRFKKLIHKLVTAEINEAQKEVWLSCTVQSFIAGGIYNAVVQWSTHTKDDTYLGLLRDIDFLIDGLL